LFCFQLCPLKKFVYAALGKKVSLSAASTSAPGKIDAKGKIPVDADQTKYLIVEKASFFSCRAWFVLFFNLFPIILDATN
jgi:hypothetical protein